MSYEELFVLIMMLSCLLLALAVYLQARTGWPKEPGPDMLRTGWASLSLAALLLCGFRFLLFERSDHLVTMITVLLAFALSVFAGYKCIFPAKQKRVDDSRRLEHYREHYLDKDLFDNNRKDGK